MTDLSPADLGMMAYYLASMLDRHDYPIDVSADDVRPHLPAFLAAIQRPVSFTVPSWYEFDDCDEMTLCALSVLKEARDRLAAASMHHAVDLVDTLAQETVENSRDDDGE